MIEDQPPPTGAGTVVFPHLLSTFINLSCPAQSDINDQVIQDIVDRALVGRSRYGTFLRTNNGRDALVDAYQELLDFLVYVQQAYLEEEDEKVRDRLGIILNQAVVHAVFFRSSLL